MPVTVLALLTVCDENPAALAAYFQGALPLLERVGARIVKRFEINEVVVGHRPARTLMLVEYPDRAAVDAVFGSEEYRRLIPIRDQAFTNYSVTVVSD